VFASFLTAAARGEGGVALVAGEPGIGKTRLLTELAARARADGWTVLSGRAYDTEGMPPYLPLIEALQPYVRDCPPARLRAQLGRGAAEVALLVPELRERLPGPPPSPTISPDQERYHLFEGVTGFLLGISTSPPDILSSQGRGSPLDRHRATHPASETNERLRPDWSSEAPALLQGDEVGGRGLLLLLDDLHWADKPTLLFLLHLARRLAGVPLLVIGAHRTTELGRGHPLSDMLADLRRERLAERVPLTPLSLEESVALIAGLCGAPPVAPVVDIIHREAAGNAFFIEEMVRQLLVEHRDLTNPHLAVSGWGIPEGVREVLGRRLSRLTDEANQILEFAAVLGDGFTFEVLRAAIGMNAAALDRVVDEVLMAGILREDKGGYTFSHALIRRTLYDEVSHPRRQRLHLKAAQAIEAASRGSERHLATVAAHYRLAGADAEPEKVLDCALRAGEAAERVLAYEDAAVHWQTALDLIDERGLGPDRRADLLHRMGALMYVSGVDYKKGIEYLEAAQSLHEQLGQEQQVAAAHALLGRAFSSYWVTMDIPRALAHFWAAEAMQKPGADEAAAADLSIGLAIAAMRGLRTEEGLAASRRALTIGERLADKGLVANATLVHGAHLSASGRLADGMALIEQAWTMADQIDHPLVAFLAAWSGGARCLMLCDPLEAQRWFTRELARARVAHAPGQRRNLLNQLGQALIQAGDLAEAHRLSAEAAPAQLLTGQLAFYEGDWDRYEAFLMSILEYSQQSGDRLDEWRARYNLAQLYYVQDLPTRAEPQLQAALMMGLEGPHRIYELKTRALLARIDAESGRLQDARSHLIRCRQIMGAADEWRGLLGHVLLAEAVAAVAAKCLGDAIRQFDAAIAVFRDYGLPWEDADALICWGRALVAAGQRGAAGEKLDAAADVYRRHGAGLLWLDRIAVVQKPAASHARSVIVLPDGLSAREVEVLRLLAAGKSNREIAARLVISPNTVTRHVSHILSKTNSANRAEAATYAVRHGLLE
jgi:DNA-binding CsgD family transcriptional regulator